MAKKALNWTEIEVRYKTGERPVDIAKDYRDCTSKKIRDKAFSGGWARHKTTITDSMVADAIASYKDELAGLASDNIRILRKIMRTLEKQVDSMENVYLFDGERVNGLFQTALNNATKITIALDCQEDATAQGKPTTFPLHIIHQGAPVDGGE